jgi:hypothetical protein
MENLQILVHHYAGVGKVAPDNAVRLSLQVRRWRDGFCESTWLSGSIMADSSCELGLIGCRSLAIKLPLLFDQCKQVSERIQSFRFTQ